MTDVLIRPFQPHDQDIVRDLILAGLGEHFQVLDPALNTDLEDIQGNYVERGSTFLIAVEGDKLIGTGGLIREAPGIGRIVRLSVAPTHRRQGIAHRLVRELISTARRLNYTKILVETNDDWQGAIRFYEFCGFRPYAHQDGEIHMQLNIKKRT